jgi:1-acyl-sn-glycerol-3-phosphate acyltransferase
MRPILTATSITVLVLFNTLIMIVPIMILALIRLLLPSRSLRHRCSRAVMRVAETWAEITKGIFAMLTPTRWDIRGLENPRRDTSYLIICNHQSWVDIPALLQTFNLRTPYFKFFLKSELIWIPFLGLAFWALEYPFMKRYSKAKLERHPHLKGKDLEITRIACEKFKDMPVAVVNYLEGTRFTADKHAQQASPYRNLLKPKAGGAAFVMTTIGPQLDAILDVTLVYPGDEAPGFWALISGQLPRVIVDVQARPLESWLYQGDYQNDAAFRTRIQTWVSDLWQEKDKRITRLKAEINA